MSQNSESSTVTAEAGRVGEMSEGEKEELDGQTLGKYRSVGGTLLPTK